MAAGKQMRVLKRSRDDAGGSCGGRHVTDCEGATAEEGGAEGDVIARNGVPREKMYSGIVAAGEEETGASDCSSALHSR